MKNPNTSKTRDFIQLPNGRLNGSVGKPKPVKVDLNAAAATILGFGTVFYGLVQAIAYRMAH